MTIVYLQCNDWSPSPEKASRLIYDYLEGSIYDKNSVIKTVEEKLEWVKTNKLCINTDIWNMSIQYWITTTKEWLELNFPELLPYCSETPDDDYYLEYTEDNYGEFYINDELKRFEPETYEKEKHRLLKK